MKTNLITTGIDSAPANGDSSFPTDAFFNFLPLGGTVFDGSSDLLVFHSDALNLIDEDNNGVTNVYLYNRKTGIFNNLTLDTFNQGTTNEPSRNASISEDGTTVVFESEEGDLTEIDTNNLSDIFLINNPERSPTTRRLITENFNASSYNPSVSADGRFVVFETKATELNEFEEDVNITDPEFDDNDRDIILHNLITNENIWVSQISGGEGDAGVGESINASVSFNGDLVVFESTIPADQLIPGVSDPNVTFSDIFLYNSSTEELRLVSRSADNELQSGNFESFNPHISADGKWIAFTSFSTNLVPDGVDTFSSQIYLYEINSEAISLVSQTPDGIVGNDNSINPVLNEDGSAVAFASDATNLLENEEDVNEVRDIFVWERGNREIVRVSVDSEGNPSNEDSNNPGISYDGNEVAFESLATNLVEEQVNPNVTNIFVSQGNKPRIKADFNNNGSNDLVYQQTTSLEDDPNQAKSIFFDPLVGSFFVFTPQTNTPGLIASAVGNFDNSEGNNPEILYYDPETGHNFLYNPLDSVKWTVLRDPNQADAILSTPGIIPKTAVDRDGDGNFEIVYRNESNRDFSLGQNFLYDPLTRQFSLLNVTEDSPQAAGQLDEDNAAEIIYGNESSGRYRVLDLESNTFSNLFRDSDQTASGFLATGTLNLNGTEPDLILFQNQTNNQTVTYNPATDEFNDVLTTTPGFFSLA